MHRRKKLAALFIGIIITCSILAFSWNKVFTAFTILPRLNNILYDINLKIFHKTFLTANSESSVIIADIDEKSLAAEGKWPWPRHKIAALVSHLQNAGVAVIAFDILFPERDLNAAKIVLDYSVKQNDATQLIQQYLKDNEESFDNDKILAQALSRGDTVLAIFFHNDLYNSVGELGKPVVSLNGASRLIVPQLRHYTGIITPLLAAAQHAGFVTTIPDNDGLLRRSPLFINYDNALYPSLALEASRLFLLQDKVSLVTSQLNGNEIMLGANLGSTYIPTDSSGNMLIPYRGPAFSFPYISAADILHDKFSAKNVAGKIVIIGSSAVGIGDTHAMPLQSAAYPGCEVHANLIEAILSGNFLSSPLWLVGLERLLIVTIGLGLSLFAMYFSVLGLLIATLG